LIVTSRAITSEVFDATEISDATEVFDVAGVIDSTEVFEVAEVTPFCTISKEGNVDFEVVIAAAKLSLDAGESQFVTVAVEATLQRVEVRISPDGSGVDSGHSKTVAVDVCHSVAVRTAFTTDDDSRPSFDSMNLENFSTGA
jgi:hypothetical protein